jgi:copper transport protein
VFHPLRRAGTRLAAALGVAALVMAAAPAAPAGAHATLIGTSPTADEVLDAVPDQVEMRFDEPVETVDEAVRVFGPDGERVDAGEAELTEGDATLVSTVDADQQGTYTVAWRVTSEDSHTLNGSFVFHVGEETGAVAIDDSSGGTGNDIVGGVGRWLGFAGALVAAGAAILAATTGRDEAEAPVRERLRRLAAVAAGVGVVGVLIALVVTLADGSGSGLLAAAGDLPGVAPDTRTGRLALLRAGLGVLTAAAVLAGPVWRRSPAVPAAIAGASLVVASIAGHAWTAPSRNLAVVTDAVHLGAVALWAGGLVALLVALPIAADRGRLTRRFSEMALVSVAVIVLSGVVSGWQQVRTFDGLTSTGYGQLLIVKVVAFLVLVALGWINRARLVPLVEKTIAPLTTSLRAEVLVAGVVLALTASLIHQAPARATVSEPFQATVEADDSFLDVIVDPATPGSNDVHLTFHANGQGTPLPVDAVQVTAATTDVPARRLEVTPLAPNHVTITGASLPSPGTWTFEVTAVSSGVPFTFTFEVPL